MAETKQKRGPRLAPADREWLTQRILAGDSYEEIQEGIQARVSGILFHHSTYQYYRDKPEVKESLEGVRSLAVSTGLAERVERIRLVLRRWRKLDKVLNRVDDVEKERALSPTTFFDGLRTEIAYSKELSRLLGETDTSAGVGTGGAGGGGSTGATAQPGGRESFEDAARNPRYNVWSQYLDYMEQLAHGSFPDLFAADSETESGENREPSEDA